MAMPAFLKKKVAARKKSSKGTKKKAGPKFGSPAFRKLHGTGRKKKK
jgi:hypothetical protein